MIHVNFQLKLVGTIRKFEAKIASAKIAGKQLFQKCKTSCLMKEFAHSWIKLTNSSRFCEKKQNISFWKFLSRKTKQLLAMSLWRCICPKKLFKRKPNVDVPRKSVKVLGLLFVVFKLLLSAGSCKVVFSSDWTI